MILIKYIVSVYNDDICVLYDIIPAITALIVREEFCLKVYDQNGIKYTVDAMVKYPDDEVRLLDYWKDVWGNIKSLQFSL